MNQFSCGSAWPSRLVIVAAFALGLVLLPTCTAAGAGSAGSGLPKEINVHLESGEVIEGAAYLVDYRFKVLELTLAGGQTRNVSFGEVAGITSDGVDVTTSILGPGYVGEFPQETESESAFAGEPERSGVPVAGAEDSGTPTHAETTLEGDAKDAWVSEQEAAYREARAPLWRVAVRPAANFSVPFGDYYEGVTSGVGYEGDLLIAITNEIAVRLSVSKSGMHWDEDEIGFIPLDPDLTILEQSFGLSAIRFTASGVGYRALSQEQTDRSMAYAYGGLGFIRHSLTADVTVRQESTGQISELSMEDTQTHFITTLGGGIIKSVTPKLGVDLSMNLDQVWLESESFAWIMDIRAGLVVFF